MMKLLAFAAMWGLCAGSASTPLLAATTGPRDITTLSIAERASLPPETPITLRGNTVTLGQLRAADAALQAYFRSAGSLKSFIHLPPAIVITRTNGTASVSLHQPLVGQPAASTPATPAPPAYKHVPNAMQGPIDYEAACGQISVCVYLPPYIPAIEAGNGTFWSGGYWYVNDPLLSSDVCAADGGAYSAPPGLGCQFLYATNAQQSVFPGNPPAMQSAVTCPPSSGFTTLVDPMGAAQVKGSSSGPSAFMGSQPIVCAIDLHVPS